MTQIKIAYYGHSCFSVTCDDYTIVIDPYNDNCVPGLPPLNISGNLAIASHNHEDHNAIEKVKINKSAFRNPFLMEAIEIAHDEDNGSKRGMVNINILSVDGIRIAHFGDIGCLPNVDIIDKLMDIDVAMIPIGGFYTIDKAKAKVLAEKINAKIVIPMHYRTDTFGFMQIDTLENFTSQYDANLINYQDELTLPNDKKGIIVLTNQNKGE